MTLPWSRDPGRWRVFAFVVLFASVVAWQNACDSSGGGASGEVGTYVGDASDSFGGGDASGSAPFDAHIEEDHLAVQIVTLSCAGGCADVEAVATGGHPPYTFTWDDGSTLATRQVCPTSSTTYRVTVSDTGTTGEFPQPPEVVQVPLTANVLACLDGGVPASDGGVSDAGCFAASSSSAGAVPAEQCPPSPQFVLPPGNTQPFVCSPAGQGSPIGPGVFTGTSGAVAEFAAYAGAPSAQASLGVALCQPLQAGHPYTASIDLGGGAQASMASGIGLGGIDPVELELWGGDTDCPDEELLGTAVVAASSGWTFCMTFTSTQTDDHIRLVPRFEGSSGNYDFGCAAVTRVDISDGTTSCPSP